MRGNAHVRFLGGKGVVIPPTYPISHSEELLNLCGSCTPDRGVLLFVVMVCERVNIDVDVATFEWRWR